MGGHGRAAQRSRPSPLIDRPPLSGLLRSLERRRLGWVTPIAGTLPKEVIDFPVILNALRALGLERAAFG